MNRMKEALLSDKGMKIVNAFFLVSLLVRIPGFILIAYLVWIIYLLFGIQYAESKATKMIRTVFLIFAALMIAVNLILLLNSFR